MTDVEFAAAMAYLEAGTGKSLTPDQAEVYYDCLKDLTLDALMAGAKMALMERVWPTHPSVGELRRFAAEAQGGAMSGLEAWGLVRKAMISPGSGKAKDKLPELARLAVDAIGWQNLCDSTKPEVIQSQFVRTYDAIAERRRKEALLPAIANRGNVAGLLTDIGVMPELDDGRAGDQRQIQCPAGQAAQAGAGEGSAAKVSRRLRAITDARRPDRPGKA